VQASNKLCLWDPLQPPKLLIMSAWISKRRFFNKVRSALLINPPVHFSAVTSTKMLLIFFLPLRQTLLFYFHEDNPKANLYINPLWLVRHLAKSVLIRCYFTHPVVFSQQLPFAAGFGVLPIRRDRITIPAALNSQTRPERLSRLEHSAPKCSGLQT